VRPTIGGVATLTNEGRSQPAPRRLRHRVARQERADLAARDDVTFLSGQYGLAERHLVGFDHPA
jgi:hypothetical protein